MKDNLPKKHNFFFYKKITTLVNKAHFFDLSTGFTYLICSQLRGWIQIQDTLLGCPSS